jgi:hypothetical protein
LHDGAGNDGARRIQVLDEIEAAVARDGQQ